LPVKTKSATEITKNSISKSSTISTSKLKTEIKEIVNKTARTPGTKVLSFFPLYFFIWDYCNN